MTDAHQKTKGSTNSVNPVVAGIAGAVAGGMAVAAAVVMNNKKNQKKVTEALSGVKDTVTGYMEKLTSQPIVEKSTQKLEKVARDTKQKIEEVV